jgi:hypothetical protein
MHPPRPKRVLRGPRFVDQLAEWLLNHAPFTALSLLILLVAGSAIPIPRPLVFVAIVAAADIVVNVVRGRRHQRRDRRPAFTRTNAPA